MPVIISGAPIAEPEPDVEPKPELELPDHSPEMAPEIEPAMPPVVPPQPPEPPPPPAHSGFSHLTYWQDADPSPALMALQKNCRLWDKRADDRWLSSKLPQFGQYRDWRQPCQAAQKITVTKNNAISFFQTFFEPVQPGNKATTGLLTGYYAPELPVRRIANREFYEPILAKPVDTKTQNLPRKDLSVRSAKVLAYGKPIDVFFLQIQGSGQIRFKDGTVYRAAFAGHNSKPYTSIGRVLIKRGEMTKDEASKNSIESWMEKAGPKRTKALMNENARYVFFKTEHLVPGEGPKGAIGIPLTAMGSLAVDSKHYPYGSVIWVEGKFPAKAGDYKGVQSGKLFVAQDTGGAIKGYMRGDVFFGSGSKAGAKAGVMKHQAKWTLLLPVELALRLKKDVS
ncbi:MAG: MltA domain-containing protein [Robiginitomaculum sp.]|nr:MltA domain-containing protein [Robiginitomaculum sp.]